MSLSMPPLNGLRAIEITADCAGQGAGMFLADFGMEVVKVELPAGDPQRSSPPLINGVGRSFLALNRGKRSAIVDWSLSEGQQVIERLVRNVDVLILDESVQVFDYDALCEANQELVLAVISPFGEKGPDAGTPGYDPLVQAASGIMAASRSPENVPIHIGYRITEGATSMLAVHGIMMALLARRRTGLGQKVHASKLAAAVAMQSVHAFWAEKDLERPSDPFEPTAGCYTCADGRFININSMQQRQFESLCRVMELEHLIDDPAMTDRRERRKVLHSLFSGLFETRPSDEWLALLDQADVPSGPMLSRTELFHERQVVENGLTATVTDPNGNPVQVLGSPVRLSETPSVVGHHVPRLGEHTFTVLVEADLSEGETRSLTERGVVSGLDQTQAVRTIRARSKSRVPVIPEGRDRVNRPLEGVKVIDLATMYAGPGVSNYLGDMGAEVIKVESPRLDDSRRLQSTPFLGTDSRAFMALNRNKRSIVLDLRKAESRDIMAKLVARADVLIHNFREGVPERYGLDYTTLSALNPRLVYAWVTGFGSRGPYSHKPAYDNLMQVFSGVYDTRFRRDGEPTGTGTFVADTSMPLLYSFAIGAALWAREQTGRGQLLETSLLALALAIQSSEWVAPANDVSYQSPLDPVALACPVLRCADGRFVCIALVQQDEWEKLCNLLSRLDLAKDSRFDSLAARGQHRRELTARLNPLFLERSQSEWVSILRSAGVPAMPVISRNELPESEQIASNGLFTGIVHPVVGPTTMFSVPVVLSGTPGAIRFPAPTADQHTDQILQELGYKRSAIEQLRSTGVISGREAALI